MPQKKSNKSAKGTKVTPTRSKTVRSTTTVPMAKTAKVRTLPFGFRLQHREFITSLTSGTSYAFDLSVTDDNTFPWLSQVAVYFDQYRVWKCRVVQETAVSASTSGTAAIAYEPNASDEPPSTLAGLLQMALRDSGALWQNHTISVPSAQLNRAPGPVRFTHISADNDPLLRSFGSILLNSETGGSPLVGYANLYIEYDIELLNPQPAPALSNVPDESAAVVQMPNRDEEVSFDWGSLLTTAQAVALRAGLCPGVELIDTSEVEDVLKYSGTSNWEASPLELEFREPGRYLVTMAHNAISAAQDFPTKEFASVAGWTSGIRNVITWFYGTPFTNPDRLLGTGGYTGNDAELKTSSWLFDVVPTVENTWNSFAGLVDFVSKPKFPRLALGRYLSNLPSYSGWIGATEPLLSLVPNFPNYEGPQLRVTRHPRFSTVNLPPSAFHLDGPLSDQRTWDVQPPLLLPPSETKERKCTTTTEPSPLDQARANARVLRQQRMLERASRCPAR